MKIQKLYEDYKAKSEITEGAITEEEFDKAYEAEFKAFIALGDEVMKLTGVTRSIANKMIASEDFEKLMNKRIA